MQKPPRRRKKDNSRLSQTIDTQSVRAASLSATYLAPRSLMPSTQGNLFLAASLVIAELILAYAVGYPLWPFFLCAALFLGGIALVHRLDRRQPRLAARAANFICVLLVLKISFLLVAATGGAMSKFTGILYVPIFLAALYYYIPGSISVGAAVALFLLLLSLPSRSSLAPEAGDTALAFAGVFLFVSLVAGIFSHGLTRSARLATRRAQIQQRRAAEFEWFMDTSMMMESLEDLGVMLSAGLMRLQELLPGDNTAIYLRELDGLQMELAQHTSASGAKPAKTTLSLAEQEPLLDAGFAVAFWPDTRASRREMGAFRHVQPNAGSMMAVSLSTIDDVFGAVVVSAPEAHAFTERHRELFFQFARHIVYPILRIRLHALATTDTLTGLNNHRAFRRRLQEEMERSKRYQHPLSLIMLDLDHFKKVNDTQGHPAGDAILTQVGAILRRSSRISDIAARYGGEEMVVLCPETRPDEAVILAERIREAIESNDFRLPTGGNLKITISLGIASVPDHGQDAEELIASADRALYKAKSLGRNRICVVSAANSLITVPAGFR